MRVPNHTGIIYNGENWDLYSIRMVRITVRRRKKPVHEAKESHGSGAHRFNVK